MRAAEGDGIAPARELSRASRACDILAGRYLPVSVYRHDIDVTTTDRNAALKRNQNIMRVGGAGRTWNLRDIVLVSSEAA